MEFIEAVKDRRSVRKFEDKDIPEDILNHLLESVKWSPSWANSQCWEIIVIKNNEIREKLQSVMSKKNPATKAIASSPVLLAICGKLKSAGFYKDIAVTKFGDWMMYDLGIATQSICLGAQFLGLGTVIAGSFDHEAAGNILQLPDGYDIVTMIPVGYPAKIPSPPKRRELNEFVHYDVF